MDQKVLMLLQACWNFEGETLGLLSCQEAAISGVL